VLTMYGKNRIHCSFEILVVPFVSHTPHRIYDHSVCNGSESKLIRVIVLLYSEASDGYVITDSLETTIINRVGY